MESVPEKRCSTCHETRPAGAFHRRARSKDGLQANCKQCALAATTNWWERNGREKQRAYHVAWTRAHPEQSRSKSRRQYHADPAREIARVLAWRRANSDWVKDYNRLWMSANRKYAEYNHRRTARIRGNLRVRFTPAQLAAKLAYWGNRCWICQGEYQAVDHVKPLAKGGPHCLSNLRPICNSCNSKKRSKWPYSPPN